MTVPAYISSLPTPSFPRTLAVLGSTGSIGVSALDVVAKHPDDFSIAGLAGARNTARLAEQADRFRPHLLAVLTEEKARELRELLPAGYDPEILWGDKGYATLASLPEADMVLSAQVGAAGLAPTMAAVKAGKLVALANKESLVLAGDLVRAACADSGAGILPVDSEHNALFQALAGHKGQALKRLVLTASGGPFRGKNQAFLSTVTPEMALKHPNWDMGAKISIDSATLMNKGLEIIEAHHLYGLGEEYIDVVVHPQSIIHSLVEYVDGSLLAHMGVPDMRIPIAYCLSYPKRLALDLEPLDLTAMGDLSFHAPDMEAFPCLRLALEALKAGGGAPCVLNAANEAAVAAFLEKRMEFLNIPALVAHCLETYSGAPPQSLEEVLELDAATRERAAQWIQRRG